MAPCLSLPYNPQANGMNEKFNGSLKELIHCKLLIVMKIVMERTNATKEHNATHASKSLVLLAFKKGNLVLKNIPFSTQKGKCDHNWHGPYCITGIQKPSTISIVNIFDPTDFNMASSCHLKCYWTLFVDMINDLEKGKCIIDRISNGKSVIKFCCPFCRFHTQTQ